MPQFDSQQQDGYVMDEDFREPSDDDAGMNPYNNFEGNSGIKVSMGDNNSNNSTDAVKQQDGEEDCGSKNDSQVEDIMGEIWKCPECGEDITGSAFECPNCGVYVSGMI